MRLAACLARTGKDGRVRFKLTHSGVWMLAGVHMRAAKRIDADWESLWAPLTFELPQAKGQRQ